MLPHFITLGFSLKFWWFSNYRLHISFISEQWNTNITGMWWESFKLTHLRIWLIFHYLPKSSLQSHNANEKCYLNHKLISILWKYKSTSWIIKENIFIKWKVLVLKLFLLFMYVDFKNILVIFSYIDVTWSSFIKLFLSFAIEKLDFRQFFVIWYSRTL